LKSPLKSGFLAESISVFHGGRVLPGRAANHFPVLKRAAVLATLVLAGAFASVAALPDSAALAKDKPPIPRVSPMKAGAANPLAATSDVGTVPASGDDVPAATAKAGGTLPAVADPSFEEGDPSMELIEGADGLIGEGDLAIGGPEGGDEPLQLDPSNPDSIGNQPLQLGTVPMDIVEPASSGKSDAATELVPPVPFALEAKLTEAGPPIESGMTWRIFASDPGPDGKLQIVGEAHGGSVNLQLRPGIYFVHASYGRAGATRQVKVGADVAGDTVVLNAGGLRLSALAGKDQTLSDADVSFDVYAPDEDGSDERVLMVSNAPPTKVIGLNAGIYHVVCRYGDANAVVRADIKVEPGKLTEATVYQKAARLTLKLVSEHGGEALANTSWSVVTPSGDSVADYVGAFPSVVLAAGDYTAIAKHEGKIFERNFAVEPGLDRDVEVIAE
jgi:hypothetical protein